MLTILVKQFRSAAQRHGVQLLVLLAFSCGVSTLGRADEEKPAENPAEVTFESTTPESAAAQQPTPKVECFPLPSKKESQILEALEKPIKLQFHEMHLAEVVMYLNDVLQGQVEIHIDHHALEEIGLNDALAITLRVNGISLKSALGLLADEYDIRYVVRDELLLLTNADKAELEVRTKIYPVGDLVNGDYHGLSQLITTTVRPQTWDEVGGPGSVSAQESIGVLVLSQTDEVHSEVLKLLRGLRAAKAQADGED